MVGLPLSIVDCMLQEQRPSNSSSNGKTKGEGQWQASWWDVYPLTERARRPIEWSSSSTIFTSHPTKPLVVARIFSSSVQFSLPSPSPIHSASLSYNPPTVIAVHPNDEWLFAYFPGRINEGVACLWKRGSQVDNWTVKEWRNMDRGCGVVTACFPSSEREWVMTPGGASRRLPYQGPMPPVPGPILHLVTENHQFNIWYFRAYPLSMRTFNSSLLFPDWTIETIPLLSREMRAGPGGMKLCVSAAIGLAYSASTILVAMRSHLYPSVQAQEPPSFNPMDLNLPIDIPATDPDPALDYECWGEQSSIEMAEVTLRFDGNVLGLMVTPLPPLPQLRLHLTQMLFVSSPPSSSESISTPAASEKSNATPPDTTIAYLVASFLDLGDYSSCPTSEIALYSFVGHFRPPGKAQWVNEHQVVRSFSSGVMSCIARDSNSSSGSKGLHVVVLEDMASSPRKKQDVAIGQIFRLKLPDLIDDPEWAASRIISRADGMGRHLPVNAVMSPNHTLVCLTSTSASHSVHLLPKRISVDSEQDASKQSTLASALVICLRSRRSTTDITHLLSQRSTTISEVVDTLRCALASLELDSYGLTSHWTTEILGVALEIYRSRSFMPENISERDTLTSRWQTAHDILSLMLCNSAFDDCKEGDGYDLMAVWQLVALSTWVVGLAEKVMKECVLSGCATRPLTPDEGDDLFGASPSSLTSTQALPSTSAVLLCLVHPFALRCLERALEHVKQFRAFLGSLTASAESAQIAKDILVSGVDCSGIDVKGLQAALAEIIDDSKEMPAEDSWKCLAACQPILSADIALKRAVQNLMASPAIDKARLFIKPAELVDGVARLSLIERHGKVGDKDVVTKGVLLKPGIVCLRCGETSELDRDSGHVMSKWSTWVKMWAARCMCGGLWRRTN